MSRSHRHKPITGTTTAHTEKYAKRKANRALRKRVKNQMSTWQVEAPQPFYSKDFDDPPLATVKDRPLPELRELSDVWAGLFGKDGHTYWGPNPDPRLMRK